MNQETQERVVISPRSPPAFSSMCLPHPKCSVNAKDSVSWHEGSQEEVDLLVEGTAAVEGNWALLTLFPKSLQLSALSNPNMNQKGKCEPQELPVGTAGVWSRLVSHRKQARSSHANKLNRNFWGRKLTLAARKQCGTPMQRNTARQRKGRNYGHTTTWVTQPHSAG